MMMTKEHKPLSSSSSSPSKKDRAAIGSQSPASQHPRAHKETTSSSSRSCPSKKSTTRPKEVDGGQGIEGVILQNLMDRIDEVLTTPSAEDSGEKLAALIDDFMMAHDEEEEGATG